ncbi:hypothetical protein IV55_GL001401 [Furfurilactobacillus siliginis]|uniref:Low temperature requirement protein A n=1 Tax=Furfurilactobacillus siliginis TaxID=348151 RepID=A0A0R2L4X3_9LACO|nr:hypothetical protein IV55_GL001401 [Furfurilactobacillus siliginis]
MYVAIIHLVTVNLATHWNFIGIATFILAFTLVFNSWQNITWFYDLHGDDSLRTTVLLLVQVIGISLVAIFLPAIFSGHWQGFMWTYLLVQVLITYLWWSTGHFDPDHRVTSWPYVRFYGIATIVLLLAAIFNQPAFSVAALVITGVLDYGAPLFMSHRFDHEYTVRNLPFELSGAMLERYGQFTMIVLGEALADIIDHGLEHTTLNSLLTFVLSLLFVISIWWLYYMLMDNVHVVGSNFRTLLWFRLLHMVWLLILSGLIFSTSYLTDTDLTHIRGLFSSLAITTLLLLQWLASWPFSKPSRATIGRNICVIVLLLIAMWLPVLGQLVLSSGAILLFIGDHERRSNQLHSVKNK